MSNTPAIFLLTDFGTTDSYVGIMKAIISDIAPRSAVHDLNHHVRPQDVRHGAFELLISYPYLPSRAVVCAVVNPEANNKHSAIACEILTSTKKHLFFVLPNNGLLSYVLQDDACTTLVQAISLDKKDFHFQTSKSKHRHNFYGIDIFSSIAGHISQGISLKELGSTLYKDMLVKLDFPKASRLDQGFEATIIHIDVFGNLVTNLKANQLSKAKTDYTVYIGNTSISGISNIYTDVTVGEAVAYIGSSGFLEIGVRNGSAQEAFNSINIDILSSISIDIN